MSDRGCAVATYRLQLDARTSASARRGSSCPYLARARRLAPLPVAVAAGARRVDARLRRRRPDAASPRSSAARRSSARSARGAGRARRRCSTSSRTTWRPTTRTRSGATRPAREVLRLRPADRLATAASSTSASSPACASRTRRSSRRRTRRCSSSCARASSTGCASTIPTGSRTRAGTSSACASAGVEHVWVEKILEPGEQLRDWPVEGTTGYEFANDVTALFVDPRRRGAADASCTRELTGERAPFAELAPTRRSSSRRGRRSRPRSSGCARSLDAHAGSRRRPRRCHVYRTYVEPERARRRRTTARRSTPLPEDLRARAAARGRRADDEFVTRFQQTTGPVMAKGVEDTAFYRYFRLAALNEVGGDPGRFSLAGRRVPPRRTSSAPSASRCTCSPSQTHDTKRAGDVRARIGALAGMRRRVGASTCSRWRELDRARLRRPERGVPRLPDARRRVADRAASGSSGTSRRRCARRSATRAGSSRTRRTSARVQRRSCARSTSTSRSSTTSSRSPSASRAAGDASSLGATLLKLTVPGRARHLPGRRALSR